MYRDFLYFLLKENGNSYCVSNGVVTDTPTPTPLPQSPDGWQDIAIAYERDLTAWGILRSFSTTLGFVGDAAHILKYIIYNKSTEEKVFLLICQRSTICTDTQYNAGNYVYFYKAQLDLTSFSDELFKVSCKVLEGDIKKLVDANKDTTYELDIDSDTESVQVLVDGISLQQTSNYIIPEMDNIPANGVVPVTFTQNDGTSVDMFATSQQAGAPEPGQYFIVNEGKAAITVHLSGSVSFKPKMDGNTDVFLMKVVKGYSTTTTLQDDNFPAVTGGHIYTTTYNLDITLQPLEGLYIGYLTLHDLTWQQTKLTVSYKTRYQSTYVKGLKPSTVFKRLIGKITGSEANCDTTFVSTHDNLILLSGDSIRNITGAKIKTSLTDFYTFCQVELGAGMSIENEKVIIDDYSRFLNYTNVISLGAAANLKVSYATDLLGNTFQIGYNAQDLSNTDNINGKLSFNNSLLFTTPRTQPVKGLKMICPYVSDPYVIEIYRINLDGQTTTDNSGDNTVYILNVVATGAKEFTANKLGAQNALMPFALSLQSLSGSGFSANVDSTEFTYTGGASQSILVNVAFNPDNGNGQYVATLYQNGNAVVQRTLPGNGGVNGLTANITIHPGDVLKTVIDYGGFGSNSATVTIGNMTVVFSNQSDYILKRVTYDNPDPTSIGIPDAATIFNIEELTPKRLMLKQQKYINSLFYGFAGEYLKFQTTEKNDKLQTVLNGVQIIEKADFPIGEDVLFKPFYFDFDIEVPTNLVSILEQNINQCFSFTWQGLTLKGFLVKAGIAANSHSAQSYKLLATPDTDLKQLFTIYG